MYKYWIICTSSTTQVVNWLQTNKLNVMKMSCSDVVSSDAPLLCDGMSAVSVGVCHLHDFMTGWPSHHHLAFLQFASVACVHRGERWKWALEFDFSRLPLLSTSATQAIFQNLLELRLQGQWQFVMITVTEGYYPYRAALQLGRKIFVQNHSPLRRAWPWKTPSTNLIACRSL